MNFSNKKIVTAFIVSAMGTILVLLGLYYTIQKNSIQGIQVEVAVATDTIKVGELLLGEKNYTYKLLDQDELTSNHITKVQLEEKNSEGKTVVTLADMLRGKESASVIYPGEAIMKGRVSGLTGLNNTDMAEIDMSSYRKMIFSVNGPQNLSGQVIVGDKVDFWVTYKLTDKTNQDQLIIVDKILKGVLISKVFDANGQEVTDPSVAVETVEILLQEKELQEYLKYQNLGKFQMVKMPTGTSEENEVVRMKMSTNDLIWEILSMEEDTVTADKITKNPELEDDVVNMIIEENENDETE